MFWLNQLYTMLLSAFIVPYFGYMSSYCWSARGTETICIKWSMETYYETEECSCKFYTFFYLSIHLYLVCPLKAIQNWMINIQLLRVINNVQSTSDKTCSIFVILTDSYCFKLLIKQFWANVNVLITMILDQECSTSKHTFFFGKICY